MEPRLDGEDALDTGTTLTVVGCSGSVPGPDSACSCYLVEADGFRLLLDLGTGAVGPMQRYVAGPDVDSVFVTHAHGDHCHDVWELVYLRARAGTAGRLPVYGPPDVAEKYPDRAEAEKYLALDPVPDKIGPWRVRTAVAEHALENWAVRLDDRLCYTGDTAPCAAVDELASGCRVLLAEAAGFDADRPAYHLTAGDAGRLAARAGVQLLVLTHLRAWHDAAALLAEASAECACPVVLATPGLRVAC
jgi:ribonuclease BN (tRNA processing enzyme)